MKQYILTLSLALLGMFCVTSIDAQNADDSTKQELIELPFGKVTENRLVGSVDVITSEDLSHYSIPNLYSAMLGKAMGYNFNRVRGFARGGSADQPLVIIDGLSNRSIGSLTLEEVESVYVLKDITAKMLYGSRAANGVIVIKTKRGIKTDDKKVTFLAEYGMQKAHEYPQFIGAADYMKYNNQAMMNDGKDPLYTEEDIQLAGSSYKYPDIDYYDMFANDQRAYQRISAQLEGGNNDMQYFFNLGYIGDGGLEKVGDKQRTNTLNVRSNLDYKVNDLISVNLDIAGRFYMIKSNHVGSGMFSKLSTTKPNDYPMFISPEPNVDSLGTSDKVGGYNLYGAMVYSGYQRQETSFAQTNIGMNFDFNKYVEGLTGRVYTTFDINNYIAEGKSLTYRTLKPALTAEGIDTLIVNGVYNPKGNESLMGNSYYRNIGGGAHLDYNKVFGDHAINATLSYLIDYKTVKTNASDMLTIQDDKSMNVGFRANYAYKNKYIAEVSSSYMGSGRFAPENRWKLFGAAGVSYVLSEEDFMKDIDAIDFLKLKASYGSIGYDQSFPYLLYNNYYQYWAGSYNIGVKNSDQLVGTQFIQKGNMDLTYEVSTEMNVGLSMRLFGNRLAIDAEYFNESRTGMPTTMRYAYPQLIGSPSIVANYNAIDNKGYEFSAQYTEHIGDFMVSLGGYITGYKSTWTQYDELNDFSFQNTTGTATDAIWGYKTDGFYTTADEIETYGAENGVPLTSSLGTVIPGDLKIIDQTDNYDEYTMDDNVINGYDRSIIGNSRPRYTYALNIQLKYKGLSLYVLGQGVGGYNRMYTWPSYYTNKGNVNYSKFVYDAAVPTFDEAGNAVGLESNDYTLPRLTTESSTHSYNGSTFWMRNAYYFKLRTVELDYQLPSAVAKAITAEQLNIFVKGDNMFTTSEETELDPEYPSAGLTGYPVFSTVSIGMKLTF